MNHYDPFRDQEYVARLFDNSGNSEPLLMPTGPAIMPDGTLRETYDYVIPAADREVKERLAAMLPAPGGGFGADLSRLTATLASGATLGLWDNLLDWLGLNSQAEAMRGDVQEFYHNNPSAAPAVEFLGGMATLPMITPFLRPAVQPLAYDQESGAVTQLTYAIEERLAHGQAPEIQTIDVRNALHTQNPDVTADPTSGGGDPPWPEYEDFPFLARTPDGQLHILDGHHRITEAARSDDPYLDVYVVNLTDDAQPSPAPQPLPTLPPGAATTASLSFMADSGDVASQKAILQLYGQNVDNLDPIEITGAYWAFKLDADEGLPYVSAQSYLSGNDVSLASPVTITAAQARDYLLNYSGYSESQYATPLGLLPDAEVIRMARQSGLDRWLAAMNDEPTDLWDDAIEWPQVPFDSPAATPVNGMTPIPSSASYSKRHRALFNVVTDNLNLNALQRRAIDEYTGSYYEDFNNALRAGRGEDYTSIAVLDSVFARSSLPENMVTYRWVPSNVYSELARLRSFTDPAFVSTSTDRHLNFNTERIRVELPRGAQALPLAHLSDNYSEREVLINRNSVFDIYFNDDGEMTMRLRVPENEVATRPSVMEMLGLGPFAAAKTPEQPTAPSPVASQFSMLENFQPPAQPFDDPALGVPIRQAHEAAFAAAHPEPLTASERQALWDYNSPYLSGPDGTVNPLSYGAINGMLRGQKDPVYEVNNSAMEAMIHNLDNVFSGAQLPQDIVTYRWVSDPVYDDISALVGDLFYDAAFTSTSTNPNYNFGAQRIRVEIPRGSQALPISHLAQVDYEREVLIARDALFDVYNHPEHGLTLRLRSTGVKP